MAGMCLSYSEPVLVALKVMNEMFLRGSGENKLWNGNIILGTIDL